MIEDFIKYLTYKILPLPKESYLAGALNFFIYDTIKILFLLCVIIFSLSLVRTYFSPEKIRNFLSNKREFMGNILAAFLGIITPFCSCSAVPLFIGFIEAEVPLGVAFSFLISSPMINELAVVLLWGLFGWKITMIYIGTGLAIAIICGCIIGRLKLGRWVEDYIYGCKDENTCYLPKTLSTIIFSDRVKYAKTYTLNILKKTWLFIIIAVGIGAFLHGYIPRDFLIEYAGRQNFFAVPIAVAIGVPLYAGCAGILPIVYVLIEKGLPLGTALAFMMSITALSFPEMIILKKVLKLPLLLIFAGILTIAIICVGYLFNYIF